MIAFIFLASIFTTVIAEKQETVRTLQGVTINGAADSGLTVSTSAYVVLMADMWYTGDTHREITPSVTWTHESTKGLQTTIYTSANVSATSKNVNHIISDDISSVIAVTDGSPGKYTVSVVASAGSSEVFTASITVKRRKGAKRRSVNEVVTMAFGAGDAVSASLLLLISSLLTFTIV
ncbi:hypothetical protein [Largemouth bass virus]|uniref:Uncharacterized protein n=1 Tax=Largemouth bass virus TaxID=176656 RepID=A0A9E7PPE4_9VIRU|nr:hypothetical protein [Largemouth bass virus]WAK75090.1 hypothetical protein [Mandarin fish ranavirus]WEI28957.1 hypothetical protein [Largemouth bass virus]WHA35522.1 hypothetical protein MSRaV_34L [Micropterus salmoides ranavirus]WHA35627.1 hypothetical protein SCRaV_34L [Siniperca chuatsi ranavirus]